MRDQRSTVLDYLLTLPQYILPQHWLSGVVHKAVRLRWAPAKNFMVRSFVRHYQVEMDDVVCADLAAYPDFNSFFTRSLRSDARPISKEPDAVISPVDALVSTAGTVSEQTMFQAKGHGYPLEALLGGESDCVMRFLGGSFVTLYLSPRDYHRIHMPIAGRLREMIYVPGRLFSVNERATRVVPGLFARNERVVAIFDTVVGPMAIILVGALFVGSIETVWAGEVNNPTGDHQKVWKYPEVGNESITLSKGVEMGRFNMGSTVILLFGSGAVSWENVIMPGCSLRMGERLGTQGRLPHYAG